MSLNVGWAKASKAVPISLMMGTRCFAHPTKVLYLIAPSYLVPSMVLVSAVQSAARLLLWLYTRRSELGRQSFGPLVLLLGSLVLLLSPLVLLFNSLALLLGLFFAPGQ